MKLLLFGKNGQLGWELQRSLAPLGELVALGSKGEALPSDFCQPERLAETLRRVRPDVVVNAAAYTAVDKAETDREKARMVNAVAPGVLADAAQAAGSLLVHFSTDYVYDGSGDRPWCEWDATAPVNVYGATKLEGERAVAQRCERHLIFRTSWIYAARGNNFPKTMLRLAAERERLSVIDDQFGAPTGADLIADITAHAIRASCHDARLTGLYNVAGAGETSWYGYARHVIERARRAGVPIKVPDEGIEAVPTSAFPTAARRPGNSRLNCTRLCSTFGLHLPDWRVGVDRMLDEILT